MDAVDIAWATGILEGEGTFTIEGGKYPIARVLMTDEDIIRRLKEVTGLGNVTGPHQQREDRKPLWSWKVSDKRSMARLLLAIYPLLGQRRREQVNKQVAAFDGYSEKKPDHCRRCGGADWYIYPQGHRQCRTCAIRRSRERKEQLNAS